MKEKGITILEISMGLAVTLPLIFYAFFICNYLLTIYDVSRITKQIPQELSARAVTMSQSAQSTNIDDSFGNFSNGTGRQAYRQKLSLLSERILDGIKKSHLPEGTRYCVSVGAVPVEIDNSSGAALRQYRSADGLRADISISIVKIETRCESGSTHMSTKVEQTLIAALTPLINDIRSNHHPIPSPFAIPSGLRGIDHSAYLGKSQLFTNNYTASSPQHTKTSTSFLERTMVFATSSGFDFSDTKNGKSLKYFTESTTSNRFKRFLLPRDYYSASLMYPRAEL